MKITKNRFGRWLIALAIISIGIASSFLAAGWLQAMLGLPSFVVRSRSGSPSDLVVLALGMALLVAYMRIALKLLRIELDEFSRMFKGE